MVTEGDAHRGSGHHEGKHQPLEPRLFKVNDVPRDDSHSNDECADQEGTGNPVHFFEWNAEFRHSKVVGVFVSVNIYMLAYLGLSGKHSFRVDFIKSKQNILSLIFVSHEDTKSRGKKRWNDYTQSSLSLCVSGGSGARDGYFRLSYLEKKCEFDC